MSLAISRIAVENFRKFRERVEIDGLQDGLNIVIEPNEAGKSTLLEALRAALFVRHSTRNRLATSFAPYMEAVGPEVELDFKLGSDSWTVAKRFLRNPSVELRGPGFRAQGDEAEAKLHELLGSIRDTSQIGDVGTHGVLGLLWVGQAAALQVEAPGPIVRDTVRSTLEAEVGTIVGGPALEKVRSKIDAQHALYWTPSGRETGKLVEAKERAEASRTAASAAAAKLDVLEQNFTALEGAHSRLKVLERELADPADAHERARLAALLEVAKAAAQQLETRRAELDAVNANLRALEDIETRHRKAVGEKAEAQGTLDEVQGRRATLKEELNQARDQVGRARDALTAARETRTRARDELAAAQASAKREQRASKMDAARERHNELLRLEAELQEAEDLSVTLISSEDMAEIEAGERTIAEARAAVAAGATTIELVGDAPGVTIGGAPIPAGVSELTGETRIELGRGAALVVRPPTSAESARARLELAVARQAIKLTEIGVEDLAAARARNDAARMGAAHVVTLQARIDALTQPDPVLDLAAGAAALKLLIAELPETPTASAAATMTVQEATTASEAADLAALRAETVVESAVDHLRDLEEQDRPLAEAEAGARSDLANALARIQEIEALPELAELAASLAKAREASSIASGNLAQAERDATTHNSEDIERKISTIDARVRGAAERRVQLMQDVTRLEALVEAEGGKGLADKAKLANEEADAAEAALGRVMEEAETLKLLRNTLETARGEASRTFVGPVAKRAKRHIERLLPGCELEFNEELGLETLMRAGRSEGCGNLSRGTQEQLAVLTRLAFADMLLEQGKPISLILDDPLVYSDDARLDTTTEILVEAASRMQVVLLTCRDRAFRHVPGHRIVMREETEPEVVGR